METKIIPFSNMGKFHTGTVYVFQEEGTGHLLFKTTDIRELQKVAPSQTMAKGEPLVIDDVNYKVAFIEIEISSFEPTLSVAQTMQRGENNPYGIHTVIYAEKDRRK